jgi:ornithine decarboxylase
MDTPLSAVRDRRNRALRELFSDPNETCEFERVTLDGPTCDSADVIAPGHPMPALDIGDVVVSPMMGVYTTVTSSRFNGIPATSIVMS